jgi:hypothetical protein
MYKIYDMNERYSPNLVEWGDDGYNLTKPKHRQGLIDALVDAGVLERTENGWWSAGPPPHGSQPAYRVLPPAPHVHEWVVAECKREVARYCAPDEVRIDAVAFRSDAGFVQLQCVTCGETKAVRNSLPIQVPE